MSKKIMIVDDDPSILISIRELFEKQGFEVYAVNSGMDCIKELERGFKGVILMDIMMPIMDGYETIQKIIQQGLHKNNIISILTAKDAPNPKYKELNNYIRDYIQKPFNLTELAKTVDNYFNKS